MINILTDFFGFQNVTALDNETYSVSLNGEEKIVKIKKQPTIIGVYMDNQLIGNVFK